jgi:asparagine synthase (glutamine-hydrolysing)
MARRTIRSTGAHGGCRVVVMCEPSASAARRLLHSNMCQMDAEHVTGYRAAASPSTPQRRSGRIAGDMCGIAGTASCGASARLGAGTVAALCHRGPDAQAIRDWNSESKSWEMAHARLSIVDLSSAGEQPMENEDGSLVMVFNGEIYNSPDLRRYCEAKGHTFKSSMDGEVILHLWEMEGARCLGRLNGIFAVAVASTKTGDVVLARDPVGVKPLFYSEDPGHTLWFASELHALETAGAPLGQHDVVALAQFLSFLWIPDPRTPFSGARSLEPGQALRWTASGTELFFYGDPLVPEPSPMELSGAALMGEVRERFAEAANRQLLGDVPIGLMASGGVDSGLLWWATKDSLARAYTIAWPRGEGFEGLDEDRRAVLELERRFGTPVDYLPGETAGDALPSSGDLFADPAYDLTRLIARTAREHRFKVLLSGQGADELFGGYRRHSMTPVVNRVRLGRIGSAFERSLLRLPPGRLSSEYATRLVRACSEPDAFRGYMQLCTYSTAPERAKALDCDEAEVTNDVVWQRHRDVFDRLPERLSLLRKAMTLDLAVYLPGLGLAYVDRAGMEHGIEIRVPWLDLDLVRWTLTLPDGALLRRGRGKWLTRQLAAHELSPSIAHRPKRGFAAPADTLGHTAAASGNKGYRQGDYFARAARILDGYRKARFGARLSPSARVEGPH